MDVESPRHLERLRDQPYAIAVTAADGAPVEDLIALLRKVTDHYWHGSAFFK